MGYFYPRSPCGERRVKESYTGKTSLFLSTLSLRRATTVLELQCILGRFLSTLSLRRATEGSICLDSRLLFLSTLSLRRATQYKHLLTNIMIFLSTLSLRRATKASRAATTSVAISIHALLAESDANVNRRGAECVNFYPRSPCGERRCQTLSDCRYTAFLSTLSLRRATANWFDLWGWAEYFYPRSPCGERHTIFWKIHLEQHFYPRSPCGERH